MSNIAGIFLFAATEKENKKSGATVSLIGDEKTVKPH